MTYDSYLEKLPQKQIILLFTLKITISDTFRLYVAHNSKLVWIKYMCESIEHMGTIV